MHRSENKNLENSIQLTPMEAFLAMTDYVWEFLKTSGNDFGIFIADTIVEDDGRTFDPAAWDDWMKSVVKVKEGKDLQT